MNPITEPLKIIELCVENVKKVRAVRLHLNGEPLIIGGDNDQGKSSVMDGIWFALCGKDVICDEPLRRGEKRGKSFVDLGEFNITRTFTEGGTTIVIKAKDGSIQASPQALLDSVVGELMFDPIAFMRKKPKEQRDTLAHLAGLDFTKINAEYNTLYDQRTEANREAGRLQAQWFGKELAPGLPETEVSVAALMVELEKAQMHNAGVAQKQRAADEYTAHVRDATEIANKQHEMVLKCRQALKEAESALERALETHGRLVTLADEAAAAARSFESIDEAPLKEAISQVGEKNAKIRANAELKRVKAEHRAAAIKAEKIDAECKAKLDEKTRMVQDAKFPLPALSVTDDAVLFDGIPLNQISTSQQVLICAAISIALNPLLRLLFIREGSLLDNGTLQQLLEMCAAHNVQPMIERVSKGDEVSVIIEDGEVVENRL